MDQTNTETYTRVGNLTVYCPSSANPPDKRTEQL